MATFTSFLSMRKPSTSDNISVELDLNENFEKLDDAISTLDSRVDAAEQTGKLLDYLILAADESGTVGNINIMQTAGFSLTTERRIKIDYKIMYGVSVADTGIMCVLQRQINGGAWVEVPSGRTWAVKSTTAFTDHIASTAYDLGPSDLGVIGTAIKYRLNPQAVGVNGQTVNGAGYSHIAIYDAGPI